jgi:hypothetical protein
VSKGYHAVVFQLLLAGLIPAGGAWAAGLKLHAVCSHCWHLVLYTWAAMPCSLSEVIAGCVGCGFAGMLAKCSWQLLAVTGWN